MFEWIDRNRRTMFVIKNNPHLGEQDAQELIGTLRRTLYTPMAVGATSVTVLLYLKSKGKFKTTGVNEAIKELKIVMPIIAFSIFIGAIPGAFYFYRLADQTERIYRAGIQSGMFSNKEKRMVEDPDYFYSIVDNLEENYQP